MVPVPLSFIRSSIRSAGLTQLPILVSVAIISMCQAVASEKVIYPNDALHTLGPMQQGKECRIADTQNQIPDHLGNCYVSCWVRNGRLSEVAGSVIEMCVVSRR